MRVLHNVTPIGPWANQIFTHHFIDLGTAIGPVCACVCLCVCACIQSLLDQVIQIVGTLVHFDLFCHVRRPESYRSRVHVHRMKDVSFLLHINYYEVGYLIGAT